MLDYFGEMEEKEAGFHAYRNELRKEVEKGSECYWGILSFIYVNYMYNNKPLFLWRLIKFGFKSDKKEVEETRDYIK